MGAMKTPNYTAMLEAVEKALQICRDSMGRMDEAHRKICDDLRDARDRLRDQLGLPPVQRV